VEENPTALVVEKALRAAREFRPDLIVGLGGGSSMDCAKGANFLYTNGGKMEDYWGTGKAKDPMLPMIAVPTTAGTGSEAQSYALISDPQTHTKMACGDPKALPKIAILDPRLVATCPARVAAATGIDAIAHAVETAGSTRRTDISRELSKQAWTLLSRAYERAILGVGNGAARSDMLLGAHLAGCAIENSMLGAAHALANPITSKLDVTHGVIVGLMLPHVVRFNCDDGTNPYADLSPDPQMLARQIEALLDAAKLPRRLADVNVPAGALPELADLAAKQWTAGFNPRPVGAPELLTIYKMALG
jgi:alcohol dehydrogenase